MRVRIPDAARAAAGSDGHMTVVDQASGWEYDFWQVRRKPRGGGRLLISWGGRTRIDGDGLGSDANAAHYGSLAGIIRAEEMRRGRIDHALFMLVRCDSGRKVYPARGLGLRVRQLAGAPSQGTRFQLDLSPAEIDALRMPDWKKTILRAMAEYGLYVGDTTGGTPWNIWFESGATYTSFGRRTRWSPSPARPGSRAHRTASTTSTGRAASTGAATSGSWTPAWPSGYAAEAARWLSRAAQAERDSRRRRTQHGRSTRRGSAAPPAPRGPAGPGRPSR